MKFINFSFLIFFFLTHSSDYASAQKPQTESQIKNRIFKILKETDPYLNIGIAILDKKTGRKILSHNEERYYTPASVNKIFLAAAALKILGHDYTFQTQLSHHGRTYYVRFGADPYFTHTDLEDLLSPLKDLNKSDPLMITIDRSHFSLPKHPFSWTHENTTFCQARPLDSALINKNTVSFYIFPEKNKNKARIEFLNDPIPFEIENKSTVGPCTPATEIKRKNLFFRNKIILSGGCVPMTLKICLPPEDLDQYILDHFHHVLKKMGFRNYRLVFGDTPPKTAPLKATISEPVSRILKDVLSRSDNYTSDVLYLELGQVLTPVAHEWADVGIALKKGILKKFRFDLQKTIIRDGSGLSRHNATSPRLLAEFIRHALSDCEVGPYLREALPTWGESGTLENRTHHRYLDGKAHLKTGTMNGISALAGQLTAKSGKEYIIAIMSQGLVETNGHYITLEDKILKEIASGL